MPNKPELKVVTKTVYYCPFCRKKGFTRPAMQSHLESCVKNPDRRCGWCSGRTDLEPPLSREEIHAGDLSRCNAHHESDNGLPCPVCTLAEIIKAGCSSGEVGGWHTPGWDYEAAVKEFRELDQRLRAEEHAAACGGYFG